MFLTICCSFQGDDFEVKNREKRHSPAFDSNGNRILRVVKRDATEMAEVETTERIIQVIEDFFNPRQFHEIFGTHFKVRQVVLNKNRNVI